MRFRLIDAAKKEFPVQRLCKVLGVSQSGYFAWKDRPACRRQNEDMVLLAHIRSAFALSNATYGSPRMTRELRDDGITIGRHRVARLMRENALKARRRRRTVKRRTTVRGHSDADGGRIWQTQERDLDGLLAGHDPQAVCAKDGLFDELKKALAERVLNAEIDDHLDGEAAAGKRNSRNGYSKKRVLTETSKLDLRIPRDGRGRSIRN